MIAATQLLNSERYVHMIWQFLTPVLQECQGFYQETWFPQDGATSHPPNCSFPDV